MSLHIVKSICFPADSFSKAAISLIPDIPKVIDQEGKNRSSEPVLLEYICNFLSTLLVVPVSLL
jgi:hypothetical protein